MLAYAPFSVSSLMSEPEAVRTELRWLRSS
jgi:hypothetical protein